MNLLFGALFHEMKGEVVWRKGITPPLLHSLAVLFPSCAFEEECLLPIQNRLTVELMYESKEDYSVRY